MAERAVQDRVEERQERAGGLRTPAGPCARTAATGGRRSPRALTATMPTTGARPPRAASTSLGLVHSPACVQPVPCTRNVSPAGGARRRHARLRPARAGARGGAFSGAVGGDGARVDYAREVAEPRLDAARTTRTRRGAGRRPRSARGHEREPEAGECRRTRAARGLVVRHAPIVRDSRAVDQSTALETIEGGPARPPSSGRARRGSPHRAFPRAIDRQLFSSAAANTRASTPERRIPSRARCCRPAVLVRGCAPLPARRDYRQIPVNKPLNEVTHYRRDGIRIDRNGEAHTTTTRIASTRSASSQTATNDVGDGRRGRTPRSLRR